MPSYKDYYNGLPLPPQLSDRPTLPRQLPPSRNYIPPTLRESNAPPAQAPAPSPYPMAPRRHLILRNQNSLGSAQANPFAAMFGMMGGYQSQQPGYGYQPPTQGGQYSMPRFSDMGPGSFGGGQGAAGSYVNGYSNMGPGSIPTGPSQIRERAPIVPFAYGAPQGVGNPYLPRMF